jgi:hypothetical protein
MLGNCHVEAFTGERPGCVLNSENLILWRPTLSPQGEGNSLFGINRRENQADHAPSGNSHPPQKKLFVVSRNMDVCLYLAPFRNGMVAQPRKTTPRPIFPVSFLGGDYREGEAPAEPRNNNGCG